MDGRNALDGLEPLRHEIYYDHHGSGKEELEVDGGRNAALFYDMNWDCGIVARLELDKCKDSEENSSEDEQNRDPPIRPRVCCSAPL